jgi:hypothetical protein
LGLALHLGLKLGPYVKVALHLGLKIGPYVKIALHLAICDFILQQPLQHV